LLFHILVQTMLLSRTEEKKVTLKKKGGLGWILGGQVPLPFAASMLPDPCHLKKRSVRLQILLFDCRVTLELETARDCSGSIFGVESTVLQTLCPVFGHMSI
jgi:hypothetical protein